MKKINAMYRINHIDWWEQEFPNEEELAKLNDVAYNNQYDYVISHTGPQQILDIISGGFYESDTLSTTFNDIALNCSFKKWFFGHYHDDREIGKYCLLYKNIITLNGKKSELKY